MGDHLYLLLYTYNATATLHTAYWSSPVQRAHRASSVSRVCVSVWSIVRYMGIWQARALRVTLGGVTRRRSRSRRARVFARMFWPRLSTYI